MSRIGRMHIEIPAAVKVAFENGVVKVDGPKGSLSQKIADKHIDLKFEGNVLTVVRDSEEKSVKAKHGLYRQLIAIDVSPLQSKCFLSTQAAVKA